MNTAQATAKWSQQDKHSGIADWTGHYWRTRGEPSRKIVVDALRSLPPWRTLVELGCNSGPMLAEIQAAFPTADLVGLDINEAAIQAARGYLPHAALSCTDFMRWLPQQAAGSFDVILTHYTLAYVAPVEVAAVLMQLRRIAQWIVLAEPTVTADAPRPGLVGDYPEWRHDYVTEFFKQGIRRVAQYPVDPPVRHLNHVVVARSGEPVLDALETPRVLGSSPSHGEIR